MTNWAITRAHNEGVPAKDVFLEMKAVQDNKCKVKMTDDIFKKVHNIRYTTMM